MKDLNYRTASIIIITLAIAVPALVVILMYMPERYDFLGLPSNAYPLFHAIINGTTAILLGLGLWFILNGHQRAHKRVMTTAFVLSAVFLVSYVISKLSNEPVPYGGEGALRYIYFFVLITHIVLSAIIVPLVLYTMYFSWTGRYARHKKIARITWPIWMYIAITGVLVYVFMYPYY